MIGGVSGCASNRSDTKFTAAAFVVVERAIDLTPGVSATFLDDPAPRLGVFQGFLNFFLRVLRTPHQLISSM